MKTPLHKKGFDFLVQASLLYKDTCPEVSRHLLQGAVEATDDSKDKPRSILQSSFVCSFCYQWLEPDNHRVRIRPKPRPSARVQGALRRMSRGGRVIREKKLVKRFYNSSSVLMATCHTCNKTSRHKGMGREFITTLSRSHSAPGSTGKHKTPPSANRATPKMPSKDKTPVHTPRSSISSSTPGSGSSSSKSPASKGKNWVVQRLSKILMREDSQGKKKGGLKDFLSSL